MFFDGAWGDCNPSQPDFLFDYQSLQCGGEEPGPTGWSIGINIEIYLFGIDAGF